MTYAELENYYILAEQKNMIEAKYMPSVVSAVNTEKPSIQSNTIAKTTENMAIQRLDISPFIKKEYHRVCTKLIEIETYIDEIPDELIRAVAIRRFIYRQSFRKIALSLHYSRSTVQDKLIDYVEKTDNRANIPLDTL